MKSDQQHLVGDGLRPADLVAHGAGGRAEHEAGVDPQPRIRLHAGHQRHGGGGRDEARREVGRAPVTGALLVGERQLDQARLRPRPAQQLHPDRHVVVGEATRHGDGRQAGRRAQGAVAAGLRLADGSRRPADGRVDQRIELLLVEQRGHRGPDLVPLGEARAIVLGVQRLDLQGAGEATLENAVVEPRGDEVRQRADVGAGRRLEIGVELERKLLADDRRILGELARIELLDLDDRRAQPLHVLRRALDDVAHRPAGIALVEHGRNQAEPRPVEPARVQGGGVGIGHVALAQPGGLVGGVEPDRRVERVRQIPDRPREGAADVLRRRQRHDAVAAGQPACSAQSDQRVVRRGDADGPAGVAAHPEGPEAGPHRGARSAARPARIAVGVVGIARLAAERRHGRDAASQLVHVRLAEDDGARLSEAPHLRGVVRRNRGGQAESAGRRRHVGGVVVVLDHHRDAVQRPAHVAGRALGIEIGGDLGGARVDGDHRVEGRAALVVGRDPFEVGRHELYRGDRAVTHRGAQLADRFLRDVEAGGRRGGRCAASDGQAGHDREQHPNSHCVL